MEYKILQLKKTDEARKYLFLPYRENRVPEQGLYDVVYSGVMDSTGNTFADLERLFIMFNLNHPADFRGHSLSVSDVVAIEGKHYYCDSIGFVELNWL
jgi:hypothetical protein